MGGGGGWVVRVGAEGAYPDPVVTSCHVKVAMGLVTLMLRIGAWSGVKHLDRMAQLVCLHYSGCLISAYEDGKFRCHCWSL